jgi:anti-sigma factor RsiW
VSNCEENVSRIDLYLDDELGEDELDVFNRHMKECSSCWEELTERRRFLERIRAARPLYTASPKFRTKMAALLTAAPVGPSTAPTPRRMKAMMAKGDARSWLLWLWSKPIPALIAFVLTIAGAVLLWKVSMGEARANAFVDMAVQTHRQQLAGHLPLEITTNSPTEMSAWFANRVPFHFRLPTYQETTGQDQTYELTGGRLVNFKGAYTAYIAYRMQTQIISLVVTSTSSAVASGGERTVSKGLTFHAHRREELQVVTWSVHNLTYALVSGVNLSARQSCTVCHASAKDRNLIRDLKSRSGWTHSDDVLTRNGI